MMAQINLGEENRSMYVLDPCCGSGRMLMACGKHATFSHTYYAIDIDPLCVKMTALNLFLNGLRGEVVCEDALIPDDFRFGYSISSCPLGIRKVEKKEESMIWKINQNTLSKTKEAEPEKLETVEPKKLKDSQLQLFLIILKAPLWGFYL